MEQEKRNKRGEWKQEWHCHVANTVEKNDDDSFWVRFYNEAALGDTRELLPDPNPDDDSLLVNRPLYDVLVYDSVPGPKARFANMREMADQNEHIASQLTDGNADCMFAVFGCMGRGPLFVHAPSMHIVSFDIADKLWNGKTGDQMFEDLAAAIRQWTIAHGDDHIMFMGESEFLDKRCEEYIKERMALAQHDSDDDGAEEVLTEQEFMEKHENGGGADVIDEPESSGMRVPEELLEAWKLEYRTQRVADAGWDIDGENELPLSARVLPRWMWNLQLRSMVCDPIVADILRHPEPLYSVMSVQLSKYSPFHLDSIGFRVEPRNQDQFRTVLRTAQLEFYERLAADPAAMEQLVRVGKHSCETFCWLNTQLALCDAAPMVMEQYRPVPSSALERQRAWDIVSDIAATYCRASTLPVKRSSYFKFATLRISELRPESIESDLAAMQTRRQAELCDCTRSPFSLAFSFL
jgi:hypothetical protein